MDGEYAKSSTLQEFTTTDLMIAIVLYYHEFKLIHVERISQDRSRFVFEDQEIKRKELLRKFVNHELKTDPKKWETAKRDLKSFMLNY